MTKLDFSTTGTSTALFYIDEYFDIHETLADAEFMGCRAEITVNGMYPGSMDEWKQVVLGMYYADSASS